VGAEDPEVSGLPVLLSEEAAGDPSTRGDAGLELGVATPGWSGAWRGPQATDTSQTYL
jgi:hypothetical protein